MAGYVIARMTPTGMVISFTDLQQALARMSAITSAGDVDGAVVDLDGAIDIGLDLDGEIEDGTTMRSFEVEASVDVEARFNDLINGLQQLQQQLLGGGSARGTKKKGYNTGAIMPPLKAEAIEADASVEDCTARVDVEASLNDLIKAIQQLQQQLPGGGNARGTKKKGNNTVGMPFSAPTSFSSSVGSNKVEKKVVGKGKGKGQRRRYERRS